MSGLEAEELELYSRHLAIDGFVAVHQERLRSARVLVVGAGGLGVPVLLYLCAAGVGTLGIADNDVVSLSNLQRQPLYGRPDLGLPKAKVAAQKLQAIQPACELQIHPYRITAKNIDQLLIGYDLLVDCTDNFASRLLFDKTCQRLGKNWVYGSVQDFMGQLAVFSPDATMGYRDTFGEPSHEPAEPQGVLGAMPGIIGSLQALEVIKLVTGLGEPLKGKLLVFDGLKNMQQVFSLG